MRMKKIISFILTILIISVVFSGCAPKGSQQAPTQKEKETLVIYSYDSFVSYGLPDATNELFEEKYNCKIEYRTFGGVGNTLNRLIIEKNNPQADVFVGLNMNNLQKALDNDLFVSYKPKNYSVIPRQYIIDKNWHITPFDGPNSLAIIYDSKNLKNPPQSFSDLLKPEYRGKLILEDPRTSSPGMGFLLWTIAIFGENGFIGYWEKLKPTIFHIYPNWDSAFTAFTKGEAPMMISYNADPAYFYNDNKSTRYKAIVPREGGWLQLEFAGVVKDSKHEKLAKEYIDFMLSKDFQKEIPLHQWTFPIDKSIMLPECFKYAAKTNKYVSISPEEVSEKSTTWLKEWVEKIASD
jgi:thiamine transport system substrate-binding protein